MPFFYFLPYCIYVYWFILLMNDMLLYMPFAGACLDRLDLLWITINVIIVHKWFVFLLFFFLEGGFPIVFKLTKEDQHRCGVSSLYSTLHHVTMYASHTQWVWAWSWPWSVFLGGWWTCCWLTSCFVHSVYSCSSSCGEVSRFKTIRSGVTTALQT